MYEVSNCFMIDMGKTRFGNQFKVIPTDKLKCVSQLWVYSKGRANPRHNLPYSFI